MLFPGDRRHIDNPELIAHLDNKPSTPRARGAAHWGILVTNKRLKPSCDCGSVGNAHRRAALATRRLVPFQAGITQPLEEQQDDQNDGQGHVDGECQQQLRERAHGNPSNLPARTRRAPPVRWVNCTMVHEPMFAHFQLTAML